MKTDVFGVEYDLNDLFNFSFQFESLKKIIVALLQNHKDLTTRIDNFDERMKGFQETLKFNSENNQSREIQEDFDKRLKFLEFFSKKKKKPDQGDSKKNSPEAKEPSPNKPPNEPEPKHVTDNNEAQDDKTHEESNDVNAEMTEELLRRIINLESKFSSLALDLSSSKIERLNEAASKVWEMKYEMANMVSKVDALSVKYSSLNIADLLGEAKLENGNIDASKLLVGSLEKKLEERINVESERIGKIGNEFENYRASKANFEDTTNTKLRSYLVEVNNFSGHLTNLSKKTDDFIIDIERDIDEKIKKITEEQTRKNEEIMNMITQVASSLAKKREEPVNKEEPVQENLNKKITGTEGESSQIHGKIEKNSNNYLKLSKRVTEIERTFKVFSTKLNREIIYEEFGNIRKELRTKNSTEDFLNQRDRIDYISNVISNLKDTSATLVDESEKTKVNISNLFKKFEGMNNNVLQLKNNHDLLISISKERQKPVDFTKFLERQEFADFLRVYKREMELLKLDSEQNCRKNNDIENDLKAKAFQDDLKKAEYYLDTKIEEFKLFALKKFGDRINMEKAFKFLELEIKHIYELTNKPNEKGDSWLLAKKGLNPHVCASCEAYIGELQEKGEYLSWKKIPGRMEAPEDAMKGMRIGNGFSKILNLLKIDKRIKESGKKTKEEDKIVYDSDGELLNTKSLKGTSNRNLKLAMIQKLPSVKQSGKLSQSCMDSADQGMDREEEVCEKEPKVVKIIKKSRGKSEKSSSASTTQYGNFSSKSIYKKKRDITHN